MCTAGSLLPFDGNRCTSIQWPAVLRRRGSVLACAGAVCMGCSDLPCEMPLSGLGFVFASVLTMFSPLCISHGSWSLLPIDVAAPGALFANVPVVPTRLAA